MHGLANRIAYALAPIQHEYEVVGGDQLHWTEKSIGTSSTTWTLRHAAK